MALLCQIFVSKPQLLESSTITPQAIYLFSPMGEVAQTVEPAIQAKAIEEALIPRYDAIFTLQRGLALDTSGQWRGARPADTIRMPAADGPLDGWFRPIAISLMRAQDPSLVDIPVYPLGRDAEKDGEIIPYRTALAQQLRRLHIQPEMRGEAIQPNTTGELAHMAEIIYQDGLRNAALVTGLTQAPRLQVIGVLLDNMHGPTVHEAAQQRFAAVVEELPLAFALFADEETYQNLVDQTQRAQEAEGLSQEQRDTELLRLYAVHIIANDLGAFFHDLNPAEAASQFVHNYNGKFQNERGFRDLREVLTPSIIDSLGRANIDYTLTEDVVRSADRFGLRKYVEERHPSRDLGTARTLAHELFGVTLMLSPEFEYTYYTDRQNEVVRQRLGLPASQAA